jgi:hypothetical protein
MVMAISRFASLRFFIQQACLFVIVMMTAAVMVVVVTVIVIPSNGHALYLDPD